MKPMLLKRCVVCCAEFETKQDRRTTCSPLCYRVNRGYQADPRTKPPPLPPPKKPACVDCGIETHHGRCKRCSRCSKAHKLMVLRSRSAPAKPRQYACILCGAECESHHKHAKYCEMHKEGRIKGPFTKICSRCCTVFVSDVHNKRYCSGKCAGWTQNRRYRQRRRAGLVIPSLVVSECAKLRKLSRHKASMGRQIRLQVKRQARKKWLSRFNITMICAECSGFYRAGDRNPRSPTHSRYCSDECGARADKRRSRTKQRRSRRRLSGTFDPNAVMKRDRYKCQRCGIHTPKHLRGTTHDSAPEMDHIIPVAMGGANSEANIQCLCRKCNADKSSSIPTIEEIHAVIGRCDGDFRNLISIAA